jgi:hypothetical protein
LRRAPGGGMSPGNSGARALRRIWPGRLIPPRRGDARAGQHRQGRLRADAGPDGGRPAAGVLDPAAADPGVPGAAGDLSRSPARAHRLGLLWGSRPGRIGRCDGSSRSAIDQNRVVTPQVLHEATCSATAGVRAAATTRNTPTKTCCKSSPRRVWCNVVRQAGDPRRMDPARPRGPVPPGRAGVP